MVYQIIFTKILSYSLKLKAWLLSLAWILVMQFGPIFEKDGVRILVNKFSDKLKKISK